MPAIKVQLSEVPAEMEFGLKHVSEGSEPMKGWAGGTGWAEGDVEQSSAACGGKRRVRITPELFHVGPKAQHSDQVRFAPEWRHLRERHLY